MIELTADFNGPWRGEWLWAEGDPLEVAASLEGDRVRVSDLEGNSCQGTVRGLSSSVGFLYVELDRSTWAGTG